MKSKLRFIVVTSLLVIAGCAFALRTPFHILKSKKPNLFRGVFHVHTEYSHDCKTPLKLIIDTAQQAGLDFVVITDHNNMDAKEHYHTPSPSPLTLKGGEDKGEGAEPLLIFGDEVSTWNDGHLVALNIEKEPPSIESSQAIIDKVHQEGGFAIPAHPLSKRKPWTNWEIKNFDGIEIFTFSDIFYAENIFKLIVKALFLPPNAFLESVLKTSYVRFELWDKILNSGAHVSAIGATDAHLKAGWNGFFIDSLLLYFQSVTMYVHANKLEEETINEALAHGRSFIAFEVRGIAQDFSFSASADGKTFLPGDVITTQSPILLQISAPKEAAIQLIHNGKILNERVGTSLEQTVSESGYYRVEVYFEGKIWIVSNPIYVG